MVHIFATHGAEAGNDGTRRAVSFSRPAAGTRARDGFGEVDTVVVAAVISTVVVPAVTTAIVTTSVIVTPIITMVLAAHLRYVSYVGAFADRFIDGGAGASPQSDEDAAAPAVRIPHRTSARAARSFSHPNVVAEIAIGPNVGAVEPGLIKKLASLHMKADSDEARLAERVARRPAAAPTAKVAYKGIARSNVNPVAIVAVAITVMVAILRRRQCCERYKQQDRKQGSDSQAASSK